LFQPQSNRYYDLNLLDRQEAMVARSQNLGYSHLAFASVHTNIKVPPPPPSPLPTAAGSSGSGSVWSRTGSRVCRLTLAFGPEVQETELKSYFRQHAKELEAYDLLAVLPKSQSALHACAETLPVDLIACDLGSPKLETFWSDFRDIRTAVRRGIKIEVSLQPMLHSQQSRILAATLLFELLTSARLSPDGLVLSSGALNQWDLRDPFGVCALAASLGVPPDKTRACLSANCESAVEHALVRRKTAHGALAIAQIAKLPGVSSVQLADSDSKRSSGRKRPAAEEAQVDDGMTDLTEQQDRLIDLLLPARPKKKKKSGAVVRI
uniref:Ribonuclease P protein subunit p30 n=2 Tax=Macrostomum lignano TaxID=282301 RepID=A0A1I8G0Y9_9PLAT